MHFEVGVGRLKSRIPLPKLMTTTFCSMERGKLPRGCKFFCAASSCAATADGCSRMLKSSPENTDVSNSPSDADFCMIDSMIFSVVIT